MSPEQIFNQLSLWLVSLCLQFYTFASNLSYIYMTESGSVFGMRIRIHKGPEYGSSTTLLYFIKILLFFSNKDDLLIPLSNGWVCEKRRDGSAPSGYLTTYWSPEGENFHTKFEIEEHVRTKNLNLDLSAFEVTEVAGPKKPASHAKVCKLVVIILNNCHFLMIHIGLYWAIDNLEFLFYQKVRIWVYVWMRISDEPSLLP